MGCVSSKIMTKSASFREEFSRSMRRRKTNGVEEITITKNNGGQFIALLSATNAISIKSPNEEEPPSPEPNYDIKNSSPFKNPDSNPTETVNVGELLAGLVEEEDNGAAYRKHGPSISFRTVDDFDAMVVKKQSFKCYKTSIDNEIVDARDRKEEVGSRRKALARELKALQVQGFEFKREGSLKDWILMEGGQVVSPEESYVTPKFGNFVENGGTCNGDEKRIAFDPELVEQFERAMEELTVEEESIVNEILENLECGNEKSQS